MTSYPVLPAETLEHLPPHCGEIRARLTEALNSLNRKIVVLDDDPTGVQTVHDVYVYTRWDKEILTEAFRAPERMFFILTNSRGLTAPESRAQQREIAEILLRNGCEGVPKYYDNARAAENMAKKPGKLPERQLKTRKNPMLSPGSCRGGTSSRNMR